MKYVITSATGSGEAEGGARGQPLMRTHVPLPAPEKVMLQPGESRTVSFTLEPEDLAFTRGDMSHGWEPGEFRLWIAPSSGAEASTPVTFTLTE